VRNGEFEDPRLVAVYDVLYPWARGDDFFCSVLDEAPGASVLDLGCGTGRLALGLTARGHRVTGIDPAAASLAVARGKPGAAAVTWIQGTSADAPTSAFDAAVLTSHVAQFLVSDGDWTATLADLRRALRPGGRLVFDSRDPRARGWQRWNPADSRQQVTLPDGSRLDTWVEVVAVDGGTTGAVVDFLHSYRFGADPEIRSDGTLRFRSEEELRGSLAGAGFEVQAIYGGWQREPVGHPDGELLVLARRG
jgi:SAM-dependent methyltransferase